jgi:undecaprenyl-phosphate galactose phosphotransferase
MFTDFVKKWGAKKLILSASDIICVLMSAFLALFLTSNNSVYHFIDDATSVEKTAIYLFSALLVIPIFRYYQLYKHKFFLRAGEQILLILKGLLINSIFIVLLIFIVKTQSALHDSRTQVVLYLLFSFILISVSRVLFFRYALRSNYIGENIKGFLTRRALAVGGGILGQFFAEILTVKPYYHIELVGFIDDDPAKLDKKINRVPVLGNTDKLKELVEEQEIDEVFITIQNIDNKHLFELIEKCKLTNCQVSLVSNHFEVINMRLDENEYHDMKVISVSSKSSPLYSDKFKRIFDLLGSSLMMLVLSPVALMIALAIKINSRGPVFYTTSVVGKDGRTFKWHKFRTMLANNDEKIHMEHLKKIITQDEGNKKLVDDPRITSVGRLLRKFSLDELPQLLSVFKGDMSLVGPRPCLPYEFENFKEWHKLKYKVIPGMTGLAQITARNRQDVTFSDSVLLDLYYADNQSLWLDLKILFRTIPVMVLGKGGI